MRIIVPVPALDVVHEGGGEEDDDEDISRDHNKLVNRAAEDARCDAQADRVLGKPEDLDDAEETEDTNEAEGVLRRKKRKEIVS